MPWAVTLHITDCNTRAAIAGAFVTDGVYTYATDAYGDFTAVIYDDTLLGYSLNVGKSGYVTRNVVIYHSQSGTTQDFCLNAAPTGGTTGGSTGGNGCFIVSASTGSPESAEVMRLNMLRDRVVRHTRIGGALLDAIYADYYSFSPAFAAELYDDAALRKAVLNIAVRPFIAWFELVELITLQPEATGREFAARAVLDACADADFPAASTVDALQRIFDGASLSIGAPAEFAGLALRLNVAVSRPFVRWAVFEPVLIAWRAAVNETSTPAFLTEVEEWMSRAPLELLTPLPGPAQELEDELRLLARGAFASPVVRQRVATRLEAAWPEAAQPLARAGFVGACSRV